MAVHQRWIGQPGQQQEQPVNSHHQEQLHKQFKAVNIIIKKYNTTVIRVKTVDEILTLQ
jgi:hypothetical protein